MEDKNQQFFKALKFAAYRHRFDKTKNEEPYINHLINVSSLLFEIGEVRADEILTASLLHDVIEKTNTKVSELHSVFGNEVANMVVELSDGGNESEKEKWQSQLNMVSGLSDGAKLIKLADKIENVTALLSYSPKDWTIQRRIIYIEWSEKIIDSLRGINTSLESYFDDILKKEKTNNPMNYSSNIS